MIESSLSLVLAIISLGTTIFVIGRWAGRTDRIVEQIEGIDTRLNNLGKEISIANTRLIKLETLYGKHFGNGSIISGGIRTISDSSDD